MQENQIRIVSGGTSCTTKVIGPNGEALPNVISVEILPIAAGPGFIEAKVIFGHVALDVVAQIKEE